jgi:hypothetical protein
MAPTVAATGTTTIARVVTCLEHPRRADKFLAFPSALPCMFPIFRCRNSPFAVLHAFSCNLRLFARKNKREKKRVMGDR